MKTCTTCLDLGTLKPVAIYSNTLCALHFQSEFDLILESASPEEWEAALNRA